MQFLSASETMATHTGISQPGNRLPILGGAIATAMVAVVAVLGGRALSRAPDVHSARAELAEPAAPRAPEVPLSLLVAAAKDADADDAAAREALARELRTRPGEAATDAILAL